MISVLLKLIKIKLAILKGLLSQNQKLETFMRVKQKQKDLKSNRNESWKECK